MTNQNTAEFREIDPQTLTFSTTTAQAERRKHFDGDSLKELLESVKTKGILQPIVVRTTAKADKFEVVAGERRVIAARKAGLEKIPATIRVLTDEEALDVQLIENLQREGLHELVEAEGYEDLRKRGHSVEQIAARVGKSASYVYKRLELGACSSDVRKAFYEGKVDASKALLISRLKPDDVQKKALTVIVEGRWKHDGPMSFRDAVEYVRREFMLRLDQAAFKTEDATLVPTAGACGKCPKNTAQQAGLFGDVSKSALCTDSVCFRGKTAAAAATVVASARAAGHKVLEGSEAKKALSHASGFQKLSDRLYEDNKNRTFAQLLGKKSNDLTTVAVDPDSGQAVELINKSAALKAIKDRGIKLQSKYPSSPQRSAKEIAADKAKRAKEDEQEKLLVAVTKAIYAKAPKPLTKHELVKLADYMFDSTYGTEVLDQIVGDTSPSFDNCNEADLVRLIRIAILAEHIDQGDKNVIFGQAKRHGVNVERIKLELATPAPAKASSTAQAKPKKAAKKK